MHNPNRPTAGLGPMAGRAPRWSLMKRLTSARRTRWYASGFALLLLLAGCAKDAPLDTLAPEGSNAREIDDLITPIFFVAIIVFLIVAGMFVYIAMKFRATTPDDPDQIFDDEEFPTQSHGNTMVELFMTAVPALILAVIGFFSVVLIFDLDDVDAAPANATHPDMVINVVGQQWWWEYQYHLDGNTDTPPDLITANDLVIPVEQEIRIYTSSRDVIHSFWIPKLNGKKDAVPGRIHPWVIQADNVGRYAGQCTEFCGLSHGYMKMYAVSLSMSDWAIWVDQQTTARTPLEEGDDLYEGEQLFINNCARCHVINGVTERDVDGDGEMTADSLAMYGSLDDYHGTGASLGKYTGDENLTAGAAPNMTHFATRSSYAGSFFELYTNAQEIADNGDYLRIEGLGVVDRNQLADWLRNPAGEKPNAAGDMRGMPNLGLSEAQIESLIDYILSLR